MGMFDTDSAGGLFIAMFIPVAIFVGLVLWAMNAMSLRRKFIKLGQLKGKKKAEIIAAAGAPCSISATPTGQVLLQWMQGGYHICLIFDGETCQGISHESSV